MMLDVFAVIYKMNRIMITTTSIMNKENYTGFVLSGVLELCTHVLGLQDVNGERERALLYTPWAKHKNWWSKSNNNNVTTQQVCERDRQIERRVRER